MCARRRLLGSGALALALSAGVTFLPNMALAQPQQVLRDGAESAAMHNAAYDRGLAESYTSPETIGEMLQCSALWQRWSGILGVPRIRHSLRTYAESCQLLVRKSAIAIGSVRHVATCGKKAI